MLHGPSASSARIARGARDLPPRGHDLFAAHLAVAPLLPPASQRPFGWLTLASA